MAEGKSGSTFIGVGAFLIFLGALFFLLVYLNFLANEIWLISWITTNRVSLGGIAIGVILLIFGLHKRSAFKKSEKKIAELENEKKVYQEKLMVKSMELGRAKAKAERKEFALKLTRGQLKKAKQRAKKKEKAMLRVMGKLGERSKRLKRIRKLSDV